MTKMETRILLIFSIMVISLVSTAYATDQLIADNPDEPNMFGYFVTIMSGLIVGSFVILKIKKWRNKK